MFLGPPKKISANFRSSGNFGKPENPDNPICHNPIYDLQIIWVQSKGVHIEFGKCLKRFVKFAIVGK